MKTKGGRAQRPTGVDQLRAEALSRLGVTEPRELRLKVFVGNHVQRVLDATESSVALAAELLDVHRRTIERLRNKGQIRLRPLKKKRHSPPKRKSVRPRIDAHRVLELRTMGATWDEIARQLGCSTYGAQLAAKRLAEGSHHSFDFSETQISSTDSASQCRTGAASLSASRRSRPAQ